MTSGGAAALRAEVGATYPSGFDRARLLAPRFGLLGLPTTIVVDASGTIVARRAGEVSERELVQVASIDAAPTQAGTTRRR